MAALREALSWFLNLILPGAGLILRRREWLGFFLAIVFGIWGNIVLAGWLIAPAAIPAWLTDLAFLFAVLTWITAQFLFRRQGLSQVQCANDVSTLLREARRALDSGEVEPARTCIESGLAIDEENVELHALEARLLALEGSEVGARRA